MPQIIDIQRVTVLPETLLARVRIADDAPLMTDEDLEGTDRILDLMPELEHHLCLGDIAPHFGEVAQMTELAHLLEHVSVEIMARTELGGDISAGRTRQVSDDPRVFEIELDCPDDVLAAGALSSAAWIMEWAYTGGGDPTPDVAGIAEGLVQLLEGLEPVEVIEPEPETEPELELESESKSEPEVEPETDSEAETEGAPVAELEPEPEPDIEAEPEPESDTEVAATQSELVFEDGIAVMPSPAATSEKDVPATEDADAFEAHDADTTSVVAAEAGEEEEAAPFDDQINWFSSYRELMQNLEKADDDS